MQWLVINVIKLVNPLFAFLDAEVAHRLAASAAAGCNSKEKRPDPTVPGLDIWGKKFSNPILVLTNTEPVEGLLGSDYFCLMEVGSVTPIPQEEIQSLVYLDCMKKRVRE